MNTIKKHRSFIGRKYGAWPRNKGRENTYVCLSIVTREQDDHNIKITNQFDGNVTTTNVWENQ